MHIYIVSVVYLSLAVYISGIYAFMHDRVSDWLEGANDLQNLNFMSLWRNWIKYTVQCFRTDIHAESSESQTESDMQSERFPFFNSARIPFQSCTIRYKPAYIKCLEVCVSRPQHEQVRNIFEHRNRKKQTLHLIFFGQHAPLFWDRSTRIAHVGQTGTPYCSNRCLP